MAENTDETKKAEENLDLSGLSSMSLGPDWVSGKKPRTHIPREIREDSPRARGGPNRDRRGFKPRRQGGRDGGGRPHRHPRGERPERREREPFEPVVHVDFYPEEEPFRILAQAIRTSYRTYELFEIARLILEKPDRFVCLVRDPAQKEGDPALLHASVPDGLPFRTEEEALAHVFRHYMGEFFEQKTEEVDPPSGSFQMVHKCGMTGELLGAPNYHRYQALCREHHAAKLAHIPYSKFEQRIESSREEEDIQAWLDKMKMQTQYILKENTELVCNSAEDARLYLVTQSKDKLVRPAYSARFSGKTLALLNPGDPIRRSVEFLLENQVKFPLETANHLRGRLRRMHFAVYKRGSKGISFVCAVKRRFRKPDEVLADNLQELIDFLEAHQNFPAKDLPKAFLGIDPQKKPKVEVSKAAEEVAAELGAPVEGEAKPAEDVAEKPAADPEEDLRAIQQLKVDLRYLVSEGYVTEYSDGRLFVPGIREEEIRHIEKQKEQAVVAEAVKDMSAPPPPEAPEKPAEEPIAVEPIIEEAAAITETPPESEETAQTVPIKPKIEESEPVAESTPEPVVEPKVTEETPEKAEEKPEDPEQVPEKAEQLPEEAEIPEEAAVSEVLEISEEPKELESSEEPEGLKEPEKPEASEEPEATEQPEKPVEPEMSVVSEEPKKKTTDPGFILKKPETKDTPSLILQKQDPQTRKSSEPAPAEIAEEAKEPEVESSGNDPEPDKAKG